MNIKSFTTHKDARPYSKASSGVFTAMLSFFAALLFLNCGASPSRNVITYVMNNVLVNDTLISAPYELTPGSVIRCAKDGLAILQIGEAGAIVLRSGSFTYHGLNEDGAIEVGLEKGSLSASGKKRGMHLKILTPEETLTSKRASFDFVKDDNALRVSVFEGHASLSRGRAETALKSGQILELSEASPRVRRLTPQEMRLLSLMKHIRLVDLAKHDAIPSSTVLPAPVAMEIITLNPPALTEELKLATLERKYGPLSTVTASNGKKITGHLKARGKYYELHTVDGVVKLPQSEAASVNSYTTRR